jgi:ribosome-associated protein
MRGVRGARLRRPQAPVDDGAALRWALQACSDRKAVEGLVLDLRSLTDAADQFVIVSGTSDTHVRAIAEHVLETLRQQGVRAHHVEGLAAGRWVLLDFVDFVVHVFQPALREFYQLERLWGDAPRRPLEEA